MQMVRKYLIVFLVGLLVASCAQVGVISGGDRDQFAPKPVAKNVLPLNETTNFTGNSVVIPFDEYFKLVNPIQNIRIVPPHATIEVLVKNKTLTLSWKDTLESNTTYAIYLNNAVKDLNEGNDTIIQYVFSTGPVLDTLSYSVVVLDAWSGLPNDDCVVALYELQSSKLVSLAQPSNGVAKLNYLRKGEYRAVAFQDENNDLNLQDYEQLGFPDGGTIAVEDSSFDSIPFRIFKPKKNPEITTLKFISPCSFIVATNHPLISEGTVNNPFGSPRQNVSLYIDGALQTPFEQNSFSDDSLMFYFDKPEQNSIEVVYNYESFSDTVNYRFKLKEREAEIVIKPTSSGTFSPAKNVSFSINGPIESIDNDKVSIVNPLDSAQIIAFETKFYKSTFQLLFDREKAESVLVTFEQGAVKTKCGDSEEANAPIKLKSSNDYGSLNVNVSEYKSSIIVILLQRNKVVKTLIVKDVSSTIEFAELIPGDYTFKVIRDSNGNGKWDVGEYATLTQPEAVDIYSKKIKVRAGWTIDIPLTPKY